MKTVLLGLFVGFFLGCSDGPTKHSGGNSFTTGVKGKLVDANNSPVSGAVVRLYPVDYVPSFGASKALASGQDTTNADGVYEIPNVDTGTYNLEGSKDTTGVFIDSIDVADDTSVTDVPPGQLKKLGKITGITHMPGQSDTNQVRVNIYVPGTNRITLPNIGGRFTFDLMPAGRYQIIINPTLQDYDVKIIDTALAVGEILNLDTVFIKIHKPDTVVINMPTVFGTWGPDIVYKIMNDVQVPDNLTLTILPKTTVMVMGNFTFDVVGSVVALGTVDSFIVFTSGQTLPKNGSWRGVVTSQDGINQAIDSLVFRYCRFEYANFPVSATTYKLSRCVFCNNIVRNCEYLYVAGTGINIFNNIFHNMGYTPASYHSDSMQTILFGNNIVLNSRFGVDSHLEIPRVVNNDFFNIDTLLRLGQMNGEIYSDTLPESGANLFQNPLFVNDSAGFEDYHLQANSPCKGTGINGTDMGIYSTYEP